MPWFPMFINLKNKSVLIIGGGAVALRKLQKLMPYGVIPTVIAPHVLPEFETLPDVRLRKRSFRVSDLRPRPSLVIAATDNKETNRRISVLCYKRHIPVNVADDPALCSFLFPALIQQGTFSAGISTGGASPVATAYFKERLRELLPESLDKLLSWLECIRPALKASIPEQHKRAAVFRRLFDACMAKGAPLTQEETEKYIADEPLGSVALVGAGCGKADLITMRGLRLLRQCQAVVYDDLIDPALLDAVPESAIRLYMGKRSKSHSASQAEINQKLIELARSGLRVVRLKGGDPYLFGRGGEEILALKAAGIPCQEVPGIPSAIGIAAEAGIPVTHRGVSRSLHIITAHTADTPDGLPADFDALAKLSGTLVFLMGLERLPAITTRLMAAGKDENTPSAVISGGNAPNPVRVRAPLSRLEQAAKNANASAPAIILIGDVAAMDLSAPSDRLSGLRIGITGTQEIAEKQMNALQSLGAEAVWVMRSEIKELPLEFDLQILAEQCCWLVFTSANGVNTFFRQIVRKNITPLSLRTHKFAVIGAATGAALAQYGIHADLCPNTFTSEALAIEIAAAAKRGEQIILFRSAVATPALPEILRGSGFSVEDIPIYDLESEACVSPLPKLDYLTFSSAGGVKQFAQKYGGIPEQTRCVCIGSVTAQTLSQYTDDLFLISEEISADGIVKTILHDQKRQKTDLAEG
ncbi:MAG: uroporphyrinogen-III C-methyltransferase [Lachnospiraceae bacterium]|nr:uroporphyrinogen-III C-methyltransferase [Lachnospiraceae bacterium]